ncbi:MAG: hypothetical protein J5654_03665 [Victivallales bacterium]|nr:hypothetical protein [Victivallales bacterium]
MPGGDEHYCQIIFFITFLWLNGTVEGEADAHIFNGRIDAVVVSPEWDLLFEFWLNRPAPETLEQIEGPELSILRQANHLGVP